MKRMHEIVVRAMAPQWMLALRDAEPGYHCEANLKQLAERDTEAYFRDNGL